MRKPLFVFLLLLTSINSLLSQQSADPYAELRSTILAGVKTESPRDTLKTFYAAMEQYKEGQLTSNAAKSAKIADAIRCLDLSAIPAINRESKGKEAAIFLKEVIDRVLVLNYDLVPGEEAVQQGGLTRWRLKDTEISIIKSTSEERRDEFLISAETVQRAPEFYEKIRHISYVEGSGLGAGFNQAISETLFPEWSKKQIFNQELYKWLLIITFFFLSLFVRYLVKVILGFSLRRAKSNKITWDHSLVEAVLPPVSNLSAIFALYIGFNTLNLTGTVIDFLVLILQGFLSYSLVVLTYRLVNAFELIQKERNEASKNPEEISNLLFRSARVLVVIFGVLLSLQNIGINVMSLVAGLGIGGLAFALAAKDTAANLFGSIMILIDRPFMVGDWVKVSESEGTVEEIGLRSTRIRTFYDSVISVPNMDMATTRIDNMGKRAFRRITMTVGITYDSPPEKIEAFLEGIKNIILANPVTRKDYFHVVLNGFGASSLDILFYVFVKVPSWAEELVAKQNLMLEIIRLAKTLELEFAFPTQTLHVDTLPDKTVEKEKKQEFEKENLKQVAHEFSTAGKKAMPLGLGIFRPPHLKD